MGGLHFTVSLGQLGYLSVLQHVDIIIGNSSSGLLEVPSFGKPTMNCGDRLKADPGIGFGESTDSIIDAIQTALSDDFTQIASRTANPYGDGGAAKFILNTIKHVDLKGIIREPFFDVPFQL